MADQPKDRTPSAYRPTANPPNSPSPSAIAAEKPYAAGNGGEGTNVRREIRPSGRCRNAAAPPSRSTSPVERPVAGMYDSIRTSPGSEVRDHRNEETPRTSMIA